MTIYSLDILLFLFGTSLLFHVQFYLLLPDLHTDFSRGRSGGLVFPSLSEFSTVNNILNSEELKSFPLRSRQVCSHSPLLFNIVLKVLATATNEEKEIKGIQTGKEKGKRLLFARGMILYMEKIPQKETSKLRNEFSDVARYKLMCRNMLHFYTLAMNYQKEKLWKPIPFTIASKE